MTIAEKILRAKTDYDEVYEAGKKSATESLKFVDIESQTYQTIIPTNVAPFAKVSKIGGMSHKAVNLIPFPYYKGVGYSETKDGVTFTYLEDGGISVVGTPTKEMTFFLWKSLTSPEIVNLLQEGKQYTISGGKDGVVFNIRKRTFDSTSTQSWAECSASRPTQTRIMPEGYGVASIALYISSSITTEINTIIYPMINEGTTALPYEPFFEGLRSASVSELKSEGANQFDINAEPLDLYNTNMTRLADGLKLNTTQATSSTTSNFYYRSINIPTKGTKAYFSVNATPIGKITKGLFRIWIKDKNGNNISSAQAQGVGDLKSSIDIPRDCQNGNGYVYILLYSCSGEICDAGDGVIYTQPMLSFDANVPYTKYKGNIDTLTIPEPIKSLDGYGLGKNADEYNYIDFGNKIFKQDYAEVRLPSDSGSYVQSMKWYAVSLSSLGLSPITRNVVGTLLPSNDVQESLEIDGIYINSSKSHVVIRKSEFTTQAEYRQWLADNEVYIIERLAEPIETDISAYLTDEYIEVEGGGTITAVNEYGYDAPTNISYLIDTQGG